MAERKIVMELHPKEYQLIKFIREEFKFGKVELVIHAGQPQKIIIKEPEKIFDGNVKFGKGEKGLDKGS